MCVCTVFEHECVCVGGNETFDFVSNQHIIYLIVMHSFPHFMLETHQTVAFFFF